jgi:hypothetical protein
VDTLVTCCHGRENDKKHVAAEIYDAGNARQHDDDAKRTVSRSSLSLVFCVFVVRRVLHRKLQCTSPSFFTSFFYKTETWAKEVGPITRQTTEEIRGRATHPAVARKPALDHRGGLLRSAREREGA